MAVFKDCLQTLPKILLKWWLSLETVFKHCPKFCWSDGCLQRLEKKTANLQRLEKRLQIQRQDRWEGLQMKIFLKSLKIYSFSVLSAGIAPVDLTTLSSLRACWTLKTVVKRTFCTSPSNFFDTSCVSGAQNCGKMDIFDVTEQPFRRFVHVGRLKLW